MVTLDGARNYPLFAFTTLSSNVRRMLQIYTNGLVMRLVMIEGQIISTVDVCILRHRESNFSKFEA